MLMVVAICAFTCAAVLAGAFWQLSALYRMEAKINHLQELCKHMTEQPDHKDGGSVYG